jgi:hypothetical protein
MSGPDKAAAQSAAMSLIAQYGDDAEVIAVMRAAELAAIGDVQGLAHWDAVREAIIAFAAGEGTRQ